MDSADPSDAVVIAASLDDPEAVRIVFLRYYAAIHAYAARRVGADTADEVAAGVFEVAFAARRRYLASAESARPWLFGIASRVLLRHARNERRQFAAYARAAEPAVEDSTSDEAGNRVDARSLRAPLLAALVDLRAETATRFCYLPGAACATRRSPSRSTCRSARSDRGSIGAASRCGHPCPLCHSRTPAHD